MSRGEFAQGRVRDAHSRHGELVFELPRIGAGRLDLVSQPLAEKLIEELGVNGGFFVLLASQAALPLGSPS